MYTSYIFVNISRCIYPILKSKPSLKRYDWVDLYKIWNLKNNEKLQKEEEEEKNLLFLYNSYEVDFQHDKNSIFPDYKNIKIFS